MNWPRSFREAQEPQAKALAVFMYRRKGFGCFTLRQNKLRMKREDCRKKQNQSSHAEAKPARLVL